MPELGRSRGVVLVAFHHLTTFAIPFAGGGGYLCTKTTGTLSDLRIIFKISVLVTSVVVLLDG